MDAAIGYFSSLTQILCLQCVDDGSDLRRGKVFSSGLPQEELLRRFAEPLDYKHPSWRLIKKNWFRREVAVSVCTWMGIACNDERRVIALDWSKFVLRLKKVYLEGDEGTVTKRKDLPLSLEGELDWRYLPPSLARITVTHHLGIHGNVTWDALPPALRTLRIYRNRLGGTVELNVLPQTLLELDASRNHFIGPVDLEHLPQYMRLVNLAHNQLEGELHFRNIPLSIKELNLGWNRFSGKIIFPALHEEHLKGGLRLDVRKNELEGYSAEESAPRDLLYLPQDKEIDCSDDSTDLSEWWEYDVDGNVIRHYLM